MKSSQFLDAIKIKEETPHLMFLMDSHKCKGPEALTDEHELGTVPLTCSACLDYLNACRTLIEPRASFIKEHPEGPEYGLDKAFNQKEAARQAHKFVHEMNLQEHFIFLKRMEALTAEVSFLYNQKIIKERVSDPDVVKRKTSPQEFKEAVEKQKLDQRPKKEKKHLNDFEKAVAGLMAVGVSEQDARKAVEEKFRPQGKVVA